MHSYLKHALICMKSWVKGRLLKQELNPGLSLQSFHSKLKSYPAICSAKRPEVYNNQYNNTIFVVEVNH